MLLIIHPGCYYLLVCQPVFILTNYYYNAQAIHIPRISVVIIRCKLVVLVVIVTVIIIIIVLVIIRVVKVVVVVVVVVEVVVQYSPQVLN